MKQTFGFALLFVLVSHVQAQRLQQGISTLNVGDALPAIKLGQVYNYPQKSTNLAAFYNGRPLIIAFWGTTCNTCLKSLPRLDSLRKQLQNGFNVLSVTEDDYPAVKKMFSTVAPVRNIQLPYVTDDKTVTRYFAHVYLPHIVWINQQGIVAAITAEHEVTAENLAAFIAGGDMHLPLKQDDASFDVTRPYAPPRAMIASRSLLTPYNPGIRAAGYLEASRDSLSNIDSVQRLFMVNTTPVSLFYNAYIHIVTAGSYDAPLYNRIIFKVKDASKYYYPNRAQQPVDEAWKMKALYCYELITQKTARLSFYKSMLLDLNRYFDIKGSIEKQEIPCYVMQYADDNRPLPPSKGGLPVNTALPDEQTGKMKITIRNLPLNSLLQTLNQFSINQPVTASPAIDQPVDMDIYLTIKPHEWQVQYDINELKAELNKYGLLLMPATMQTDVLVLREQ